MAKIGKILENLEKSEKKFFSSTFLAPYVKGGLVRTRIAGIVHMFRVTNQDFEGWAIFRPKSREEAEIVSPAGLADIARYLKHFQALRVILAKNEDKFWRVCPVNLSDAKQRFRFKDFFMPCCFVEGALQFEHAVSRFDGSTLWFEEADTRRDPRVAEALREATRLERRPESLRVPTLTPEERMAYAYALGFELEAKRNRVEERLVQALEHAGASLVRYFERGEELVVTWRECQELTTTVRKDNLTVVSAGICLSGEDRKFDLTSLVSVVREADEGRGRGRDYDDDDD